MGIPKFYGSFIRNRYQKAGVLIRELPNSISSFSLDMNSLIHEVSQLAFKEQNDEQIFYELFSTRLIELINSVQPKDYLILAIDGVAPMSKIIQQRQRRYKSTLSIRNPNFDSNAITPGTPFMMRLDEYLRKWLKTLNYEFKIIYSSHLVPGEGEHKIMDHFKELDIDSNKNHVIYGMDADLIVLSMLSSLNYVYLIRQDIENIVDINQLRIVISNDLKNNPTAINDFALMSYFVGSDFLPVSPMFENLERSLDLMIKVYDESLTENGKILFKPLIKFLTKVSKEEEIFLVRESRREKKLGWKLMDNSYVNGRFVYDLFREQWYRIGPKSDRNIQYDIPRMCKDYVNTLQWILNYYIKGNSNTNQLVYYHYEFSPLIRDVIKNVKEIQLPEGSLQSLNPISQLICVIPPQSFEVLPASLYRVIKATSCFKDIFPEKFILDIDGKDYEWQGIPLLPYPDINKINHCIDKLDILNKLKDELKKQEYELIINLS